MQARDGEMLSIVAILSTATRRFHLQAPRELLPRVQGEAHGRRQRRVWCDTNAIHIDSNTDADAGPVVPRRERVARPKPSVSQR